MIRAYVVKLLILGSLISTGLLLETSGLLKLQQILEFTRAYADHWWLVLILILCQLILFSFALAGSVFLWIAAPLYAPPMATFILTAGATLGGLGAYLFSKYLTEEWLRRIESSRSYKLLQRQGNFFTLFAMRIFPAFPQALINYSSGILKLRLSHFLSATILGISIKSYLYSRAIDGAISSASLEILIDPFVYGPLLILSGLSLVALYLQNKLSGFN